MNADDWEVVKAPSPSKPSAAASSPGDDWIAVDSDGVEVQPALEEVEADTELQNPLRSLLHGAMESPFDVGTILAGVGDWVRGPNWDPANVRATVADPTSRTAQQGNAPLGTAVRTGRDVVMGAFEDAGTFRQPVHPSERAISGIGRGLPYAPIAMAGAGPAGVAYELGVSGAAPFVGEYTQEALTPEGEDPGVGSVLGGAGAEIAATAAAPWLIPRVAPATAGRTIATIRRMRAEKLAKNAPEAATTLLDEINRRSTRMWRGLFPDTEEITKAPKFDLEDLYDISAYYKGKLPVDADGNLDYANIVADMLDDSLARYPGPGGPRPEQALERSGVLRDTFRRHTENLFRVPDQGEAWANVLGGQQDVFERTLRRQFTDSLRRGTPQQYVEGAQKYIDDVADAARKTWKRLPFDEMPQVELHQVQKAAEEVINKSRFQSDLVPKVIKDLAKESGGYLDMGEVQNLRSRLGAIIADGSAGGEAGITAIKAREVRDALDSIIDGMMEVGGTGRNAFGQFADKANPERLAAWKSARKAWADYKNVTSLDRVSGGDMIRLLASKNPSKKLGATAVASVGDARRAKRFAEGDPETMDSLVRSVQEHILGKPRPNSTTGFSRNANSIRDTLESNRDGAVEILGQDYIDDLDSMITSLEDSVSGRLAKISMETTTNTGGRGIGTLARARSFFRGMIDPKRAVVDALFDGLENEADSIFLMQVIAPDRQLLRDTLRLGSEVDPPTYLLRLERAIAQAQAQARAPSILARGSEDLDIVLNEQ